MADTLKIKWHIETDNEGSRVEGEVEVDRMKWRHSDIYEKEDIIRETAFGHMDWGFEEVK